MPLTISEVTHTLEKDLANKWHSLHQILTLEAWHILHAKGVTFWDKELAFSYISLCSDYARAKDQDDVPLMIGIAQDMAEVLARDEHLRLDAGGHPLVKGKFHIETYIPQDKDSDGINQGAPYA